MVQIFVTDLDRSHSEPFMQRTKNFPCCPTHSTIYSVLAITSVLTENQCSHPSIALTVFLILTLQSQRAA